MLNPQGHSRWKDKARNIWGLRLDIISNPYPQDNNPVDPQLLFSGQYYDEESGLAYNRFRYYDPETGNYLCSDPIGLLGGEMPYSYVHNVLDFLDPFGLASCRRKYMGSTPGKNSKTGREVINRMFKQGKIRGHSPIEFKASDGQWYPISQADMAHKIDAVSWWNSVGRQYGARSPEVRNWMKNSDNYYLEYYSINRSQGAKLGWDRISSPTKITGEFNVVNRK